MPEPWAMFVKHLNLLGVPNPNEMQTDKMELY